MILCFMFGYLNDQVQQVRYNNSYNPLPLDQRSPELATVFKHIESGAFGDSSIYDSLLKTVSSFNDHYIAELMYLRCTNTTTTSFLTTLGHTSKPRNWLMSFGVVILKNGQRRLLSLRSLWVISVLTDLFRVSSIPPRDFCC
jgi:glucan phosphorylase